MSLRWWLLAEDPTHERFAFKLLEEVEPSARHIKSFIAPRGRGSASAWVLKNFGEKARTITRKRPTERVSLLVIVDGDDRGSGQRKADLAAALKEAGEPPLGPAEPIVQLVPTWSIETWLLDDPDVSEAEQTKKRLPNPSRTMFIVAAQRVAHLRPNESLPAVREAHRELQRIPPEP